jgi:hypothetical protein
MSGPPADLASIEPNGEAAFRLSDSPEAWRWVEQNHNFHAHNSLIKGVDFLRKSTL